MSPVLAYLLGLATLPGVALAVVITWLAKERMLAWGWTAHITIYDDADDLHITARTRRSVGPLHVGTREWWSRYPHPGSDLYEPEPGIKHRAWWVGVGRFGGRGLSVARGRRLTP